MTTIKHLFFFGIFLILFSCGSPKTQREIEDEFVKKYAPSDLDSHGFVLATDSKVPEVHQLMSDLQKNFFSTEIRINTIKKGLRWPN